MGQHQSQHRAASAKPGKHTEAKRSKYENKFIRSLQTIVCFRFIMSKCPYAVTIVEWLPKNRAAWPWFQPLCLFSGLILTSQPARGSPWLFETSKIRFRTERMGSHRVTDDPRRSLFRRNQGLLDNTSGRRASGPAPLVAPSRRPE